ncbi:hypothetical protein [Aneurinibacillus sp. REN35]|uniref:hypothetical protein n=1 Tax=Aneurinibacillus sp. REN35 TaxID=3237286 RepID=UPI0035272B94
MKKWEGPMLEPEDVQRRMLVLAGLDLILCPEEWLRVHHYEPRWLDGVSLGIIDNGAGDDLYVIFAPEGVLIKGFDHESPLSPHADEEYGVWPGMYDDVPASLVSYLDTDTFEKEDVTFCLWREKHDSEWRTGEVEHPEDLDNGADFLLSSLTYTAEEYTEWAEDYYDKPIELEVVSQVYSGAAISETIITTLNPERDAAAALAEVKKKLLLRHK